MSVVGKHNVQNALAVIAVCDKLGIDKKYIYGLTRNLRSDTEYIIHNVASTDTLDSLALKYYGRPDLYWVIADFNRIKDAYTNIYDNYNFLYIPTLSGI